MLTRRHLFPLLPLLGLPPALQASPHRLKGLARAFQQLEQTHGGRLGVAVLDTGTGEHIGHRETERFPMCSTFKLLLASAILARVDAHQEQLDRILAIPAAPLLATSPLTEPHAGGTMSLLDLCAAVVIRSDNTAANLLLDLIGGPPGLTQFARSLGDSVTRLDRIELALNEALAGDPRDTTSPAAMVQNLKTLLLGTALSEASRTRLREWMEGCQTGLDRLRSHLPAGWRAADKTGANGQHTSNDVAVLWPPDRPPLIVAAYLTQSPGPESRRAALLAQIGRLVST